MNEQTYNSRFFAVIITSFVVFILFGFAVANLVKENQDLRKEIHSSRFANITEQEVRVKHLKSSLTSLLDHYITNPNDQTHKNIMIIKKSLNQIEVETKND